MQSAVHSVLLQGNWSSPPRHSERTKRPKIAPGWGEEYTCTAYDVETQLTFIQAALEDETVRWEPRRAQGDAG